MPRASNFDGQDLRLAYFRPSVREKLVAALLCGALTAAPFCIVAWMKHAGVGGYSPYSLREDWWQGPALVIGMSALAAWIAYRGPFLMPGCALTSVLMSMGFLASTLYGRLPEIWVTCYVLFSLACYGLLLPWAMNLGAKRYDYRGSTLRGVDLRGANLSGLDLRDCDFSHARLDGTDFTSADLRSAVFEGAELSFAILEGAKLGEARAPEIRSHHRS